MLQGEARIPSRGLMTPTHSFGLFTKLTKRFFAIDQFNLAALQIVIPAVKHLAGLIQLGEVTDNRVLDHLIGGTATVVRHPIKFRLHVGTEMNFHLVFSLALVVRHFQTVFR